MKPLIGITCSRMIGKTWGDYALSTFWDYVPDAYSRAVQHCGGAPVCILTAQEQETVSAILDRVQGVILTGGVDVNPKYYGEQPLPGLGDIDDELDLMELEVAKQAFQRNLPILAICRGIQILNISQGGTLYQDIPSQVPQCIGHSQKADKSVLTHTVAIEEQTRLHTIIQDKTIWTNSKHHQAVKTVAPGFVISARANDGIIEAIEHPAKKFALGVQWHPEGTWRNDPNSEKIFQAFIQACEMA